MKLKYFIVHIGSIVSIALAIVVFNIMVDPYGIFYSDQIEGFNKNKIVNYKNFLLSTHYRVRNSFPDAIIYSDSLGHYGLDKETFSHHQSPFNASIPGAGAYIAYRLNQEFPNLKKDKPTVYLILHYAEFESDDRRVRGSAAVKRFEKRLKKKRNGKLNLDYYLYHPADFLTLLLTWEAIVDSFSTIIKQDKPHLFQDRGFVYNRSKLKVSIELTHSGDPYQHFRVPQFNFSNKIPENHFEFFYYQSLLADTYKNGQKMYLIIAPRPALFFEGLFKKNQQQSFINWKRHLLQINTELAQHYKSELFEVWDFSGYTSVAYDQFKRSGSIEEYSNYFVDPIHFNPKLGDLMIQRILNPDVDSDFFEIGVRLTPDNFDEVEEDFYRGHREFETLFHDYLSQFY